MANSTFKLDIVTADRLVESISDAVSLVVPAEEGYLGVLAGHAPLIASLVPGEITLKRASHENEVMAVSGGFLEVTPDHVTILADTLERQAEIDRRRAEEALNRAKERLAHMEEGMDIDRARLAMERAMARLKVAGKHTGL